MSESSASAICPIDFRYGRPEVRAIFSREARLDRCLRVEAALAKAQAKVGVVPPEAARVIDETARSGAVTLARVDALERELKHDIMAVARSLAEASGPSGRWVHYGATSGDITDTALGLELKESAHVLRHGLTDLAEALLDLAERHAATPEVGRTHGQHAVPMSFGYKAAVGAAEVMRHRRRLDEMTPRIAVGKMAGAVGTGAGFGVHAEAIEREVMFELELQADEAPTQIVGRDRLAEFTCLLAMIAGTAERLATEVRNLQRTEIGEVAEAFDETKQVGSSTMAQKRNPMLSENVTSLARLVRAFALPPLENMVLWHERDLANSANERVVVPHSVVLTDDIVTKLTEVFTHLRVDAERMREHLDSSAGMPMTESVMLALTAKGLPRAEAHEMLRRLTRDVPPEGLAARAKADPTIASHFTAAEIDELLDPASYVRAAARKTERLVRNLRVEAAL
ncbi:MAG: adenylosuccinate lyase [Thermoplasmata archaeon]|nr:adenylosuccinate lyase [Thermoplasmata archaeon]